MEDKVTLIHLIYDLWETVRNAKIIDDDKFDLRNFANWIHNQRAIWIKQKHDRIQDYDDNHIQTLNSNLVKVNSSININLPSTYTLYRTEFEIPSTIELNYGNTILEVTSPDLIHKEFCYVPFNQFRFSGNGKFNKDKYFVAIRDKYWYVKIPNQCNLTLKAITIRAIFQNPLELPGMTEDSVYPLNRNLIPFLKNAILQADLRSMLASKSDIVSDSSGELQ